MVEKIGKLYLDGKEYDIVAEEEITEMGVIVKEIISQEEVITLSQEEFIAQIKVLESRLKALESK